MSESWASLALRACLDHLALSTVTEARHVVVERSWTDGPEAFCVVYRPPYDADRVVGLRRHRFDLADSDTYKLGDMVESYDLGDQGDPDPEWFGKSVADFDIGEPLGSIVTVLCQDSEGVGWWGTLADGRPPA